MTEEVKENTQQKDTMSQLESKILRYNELNDIKRRAEEEQELIKKSLIKSMNDHMLFEHRVMLDGGHDVKATLGTRTTKKVDKEELANDLGISIESAGKKDVLIKNVEEGRLTLMQYKGYEYDEHTETLSIRRVKA